MRETIDNMHNMDAIFINEIAYVKLNELLERSTLSLVAQLTRISRPTLYRWLNTSCSLEEMNYRDAAWFILVCETSPKVQLLLTRPPLSHPRLAKRLLEEEDNA